MHSGSCWGVPDLARRQKGQGESMAHGLHCVFWWESKRNNLRLASLNNAGRLWSLGVIFSCPVPGPGKQGSCLLECKGQIEEVVQSLGSELAGAYMKVLCYL